MQSAEVRAIQPRATAGEWWLEKLRPWLIPEITDICCNGPGTIWIERRGAWESAHVPGLTRTWIEDLAATVGNYTGQWADKRKPLLSATIPTGERIQFVLRPATQEPAFAIRRPSPDVWTLEDFEAMGAYADVNRHAAKNPEHVDELLKLHRQGRVVEFLRRAVQTRQNIMLSGGMGSGKTAQAKALILEIDPTDRVITIEDAFELDQAMRQRIQNNLQLRYSQGDQGQADVGVTDLFNACKRLNPNRILASEMRRGEEVQMFLSLLNSGHPGAMATFHADSAEEMFEGIGQLYLQSDGGRNMTLDAAIALAKQRIDVVIQCAKAGGKRAVSEVWYEPV